MEKLKMQSINKSDDNFKKLAKLFPNAVTETIDEDGNVVRAIDKDVLMQEISCTVVEGNEEKYQFTWPEKKKSIRLANESISKTLRPCREESVDFDKTENLYIEGDNLEVLKLLQETYLEKIKVIYIDPPYNTGSDFIYEDNFSQSISEYIKNSGQIDSKGNRLVQNTEGNGRYHTNWLNMIYPRLRLSKDLLSETGVIFISIDDNELSNCKKICDEVFGEVNFVCNFVRRSAFGEKTAKPNINKHHDYVLCYAKNIEEIKRNDVLNGEEKDFENYSNPDNDPNGPWAKDSYLIKIDNGRYGFARYPIHNPYLNITHYPPVYYDENNRKQWHYVEQTFKQMEKEGKVVYYKNASDYSGEYSFYIKKYQKDIDKRNSNISTLAFDDNVYVNAIGTKDIEKTFGTKEFNNSYPKPVGLIKKIIEFSTWNDRNAIVMDFFSGSGTTAESVMKENAEKNKNLKFILVQIPSEPFNTGSNYSTICELGKERIRRAGKKIKEEAGMFGENLDIGFRVLKCDSSNMKDVYYNPSEYDEDLISKLEGNIKEDRTAEDLLFQVMLDLGVLLSSKIEQSTIAGKKVFNVEDNYLIACFDDNVNEEVIKEIAQKKPYYFVMRDSSLENDSVSTNFEQIFNAYSPETIRKVI